MINKSTCAVPSSGCEEYLSKGGAWQHQLSCSIVPQCRYHNLYQFVPMIYSTTCIYHAILFWKIIFTRFYLIQHPFAPASDKICDLRSGCHCEVQVLGWWPRCSSGKSEVSWKSWMSRRDERWSDWNGCFIFALLIARSCRFKLYNVFFFIFFSRLGPRICVCFQVAGIAFSSLGLCWSYSDKPSAVSYVCCSRFCKHRETWKSIGDKMIHDVPRWGFYGLLDSEIF